MLCVMIVVLMCVVLYGDIWWYIVLMSMCFLLLSMGVFSVLGIWFLVNLSGVCMLMILLNLLV